MRVILRGLRAKQAGDQGIEQAIWKKYLDSLENRRSTSRQFQRAQVREGNTLQGLLSWLREQIENAQEKWQREAIILGQGNCQVEVAVNASLAEEYALRLIDGVLHRATKEDRE